MAVENCATTSRALSQELRDVNKRVLVIGGGVAGIQAALGLRRRRLEVILVEREPTIGGKMAKLDKTFPTVDCSSLHSGPQDGRRGPASQHHPLRLLRSGIHLRLCGQL
jgi:heterodisulfide reductase subunit A